MGATRTVAKNTLLLTFGVLSGRALSALLIRFMTPVLGTAGIGIWGSATDLAAILLVVTNWGLGTLLTREITRKPDLTGAYLWATLRIRWLVAAFLLPLLLPGLPRDLGDLNSSQYKAVSEMLRVPGTHVVAKRSGPRRRKGTFRTSGASWSPWVHL